MVAPDLSLTELNDIQNHDDFIIAWIAWNNFPNELKKFGDYIKRYISDETCLNYINKIKSERKIFLVLMNFESLDIFENLNQIQSIYIFEKNFENTEEFNKENHPKLVDIFTNMDILIERLRKDILLTFRNDLSINLSSLNEITIEKSLINLPGNELIFFWNQIFLDFLIKPPNCNMEQLKKDMIEQCSFEYKNDAKELERIKDFDNNCCENNVLQWYTKDSFLYRLLNKAFRTQNIEFICKFQYVIILLYGAFQNLSKDQKQEEDLLIVYRGQQLNKNTLNKLKLNIGGFISINTFFSTSCNESIARGFISGNEMYSVIFQINIRKEDNNSFKSFIDISQFSSFLSENEILFFVGTIFSIDSIEQENESIWIIKLTLQNQKLNPVEKLINHVNQYRTQYHTRHRLFMKTDDYRLISQYYYLLTNKTLSLNNDPFVIMYAQIAFFFSNFGLYEKAIELYKESILINKILIDDPISIIIHIILGYLYYHSSDYENSFIYYGIALSLLNENNLLICELYSHIADLWIKIGNKHIALEFYQQALNIAKHKDIPSLTNVYHNLISIYTEYQNYEKVSFYKQLTKQIDKSQYQAGIPTVEMSELLEKVENQLNQSKNPSTIERVDFSYQRGLYFMADGLFDQALASLLDAKELMSKDPPAWQHFPQLSSLYDNIGWLYLFRNDYLKALTMWNKGINIRTNFNHFI